MSPFARHLTDWIIEYVGSNPAWCAQLTQGMFDSDNEFEQRFESMIEASPTPPTVVHPTTTLTPAVNPVITLKLCCTNCDYTILLPILILLLLKGR